MSDFEEKLFSLKEFIVCSSLGTMFFSLKKCYEDDPYLNEIRHKICLLKKEDFENNKEQILELKKQLDNHPLSVNFTYAFEEYKALMDEVFFELRDCL